MHLILRGLQEAYKSGYWPISSTPAGGFRPRDEDEPQLPLDKPF